MSFAVVQNGAIRQMLQMDTPFTVGDKQYSGNFLRTSSAQEKLEAGVWEIIDGTRADDRFYWVSDASYRVNEVNSTVEATYPATAKDLDPLKATWTAQVKDSANKLLATTDWMIIRKVERNVDVPADTATHRAAVVTECTRLVAAIAAATDVPGLITVVTTQTWPEGA